MPDPSTLSGRTMILVEDEPTVRALVVKVLDTKGFDVIEAPPAEGAVTLPQARDDSSGL